MNRWTAGASPAQLDAKGSWPQSLRGFKAWSYEPHGANNASAVSNQLFYAVRMMSSGGTITNLHCGVNVIASAGTAALMAAYSSTGALLGQTADVTSSLGTTGFKTFPLVTPFSTTVGQHIYVAFWFTGTTGPALARNSSPSAISASNWYIGDVPNGQLSAQASLPASFDPATITVAGVQIWYAAS